MTRKRLLALALVAPAAFAVPASADPTLPGCWGADAAAVCNATVIVSPVTTGSRQTPVCAGTCVWVSVPTVGADSLVVSACVTYETPSGSPEGSCVVRHDVGRDAERYVDAVLRLPGAVKCRVNPKSC